MTLPGPSRTIIVEPIEKPQPKRAPAQPAPEKAPVPATPKPKPQKVP